MRIPLISVFMFSPFKGLQEHAEKVREGASKFKEAVRCYLTVGCEAFELLRHEVSDLEHAADVIKRRIRGHLPKGTLIVVDKFQLFDYLREEDKIIDVCEHVLDWLSFRPADKISKDFRDGILFLLDTVVEPMDRLVQMLVDGRRYFETFSEKDRDIVKEHIRELRRNEGRADVLEATLKHDIFTKENDATTIFHLIRLVEMLGEIADHAENAGDRMRSMIAR